MSHFEIWILSIGLAMDCFAVSIASGILLKHFWWRPMLVMAFFFGLFQALTPLGGWLGTFYFSHLIESVDHWIAFAILAFLGGRMVRESLKNEEERHEFNPADLKVVLSLAIATSIDALAVGVSFTCMGYTAFTALCYPLAAIGIVSFALSIVGLSIGIGCGQGIARKIRAELWGGIILISIGVKILIEHTLLNV